jgi:hypothetical protein
VTAQVGRIASSGDRVGGPADLSRCASQPKALADLRAAMLSVRSFSGVARWWDANSPAIYSLDRADFLTLLGAYVDRRIELADELAARANVVSMEGVRV